MRSLLFFTLFYLSVFSQERGNGIFIETDDPVDKNYKMYSPFMFEFGTSYLIHQTVEIPETAGIHEVDYSNNLAFSTDLNLYLFQGVYALASINFSPLERIDRFPPTSNNEAKEVSDRYIYVSPYFGIKYYFRKEKEFTAPWFLTFALGKNYFISDTDDRKSHDRFSVNLELGRILGETQDRYKFYYSLGLLIHEDRGLVPYYQDNYGRTLSTADFKTYTTLKLNIGVHFDLMKSTIRF